MSNQSSVREFFAEFERTSNELDPAAAAAQFAPVFLAADPNGVQPVPRDAFIAALPQRKKLFDSIGVRSVRLTDLAESALDDHYVLVKTEWLADLGPDAEPLALSSTFLLRRDTDGLQITVYLNHLDVLHEIAARRSAKPSAR